MRSFVNTVYEFAKNLFWQLLLLYLTYLFMITTIGVFASHDQAEKAISELKNFGVPEGDLSYLYLNKAGDVKDGTEGDKMGSGVAKGASTGAVIGGIAGLIIANGVLPGLGSLIVAGPLAAALGVAGASAVAGAATGAVAGGLIGALTHMGIDKDDVSMYEDHVRRGDILVVSRGTPESTEAIFVSCGAVAVKHYIV